MIEIADAGTDDAPRDRLRIESVEWDARKLLPEKDGSVLAAEQTVNAGGAVKVATKGEVREALDGKSGALDRAPSAGERAS